MTIYLRQSAKAIALINCSLPFFGSIICIGLSLLKDFESSTATHCRVRDLLDSPNWKKMNDVFPILTTGTKLSAKY